MKKIMFIILIMLVIGLSGCVISTSEPPKSEAVVIDKQTQTDDVSEHEMKAIGSKEQQADEHVVNEREDEAEPSLHVFNDRLLSNKKYCALKEIEKDIEAAGGRYTESGEKQMEEWWKAATTISDKKDKQKLSSQDIKKLSELAYIVSEIKCYVFTKEIDKRHLLHSMYIYYNDVVISDKEKGYINNSDADYPADAVIDDTQRGNSYSVLSVDKANKFIFDLLGTEIPDAYEEYDEYDIICRDKKYYCGMHDYYTDIYFISSYKYIGDGYYYLVFNGDPRGYPGPDPGSNAIDKDIMRLLVMRTDSKWGFTVVSKLKMREESIIASEWKLPTNLTKVSRNKKLEKEIYPFRTW